MMRAMLLVPLSFVVGGLACRYWLASAPAAAAAGLAQPVAVVTYWQSFGAWMWLALFIAVAAASAVYALLLRAALRGEYAVARTAVRDACIASALALAAALAFPVIFSSDAYAYGAYGAMALHGIDPYAHLRLTAHDPLFAAAIWQWGNPPPVCVYGPAFVWIASLVAGALHGYGVAAQLLGLRILASLALVACAPLLYAVMVGFPPTHRVAAAIGIALNPVAIWSAAEGHNDALMLAVVLAGFVLARRGRLASGAFAIAASALIKAPGLAAAAALAAFEWRDRSRFARVAAGAAAGALFVAIVSLPFEWGVRNVLVPHGHYEPQFSAQYLLARALQAVVPPTLALPLGAALVLTAAGALACYGILLAARGTREGALYMALGLWLAIPNPYPWYALWILPVAFMALESRVAWMLVLASLTIVFRYFPDATTASNANTNAIVTLCELALPFAALRFGAGVAARAPNGRPQGSVASGPPGKP
ncbi:MAG: hypothetical protein ACYDEK_03505 [Vulcanimicrobiaceae bacterium]